MSQLSFNITIRGTCLAFMYAEKILATWLNVIREQCTAKKSQCEPQNNSQHVQIYITDELNQPETAGKTYLHVKVREANMHPLHILALSGQLQVFGQKRQQPFFPKYLVEMTVTNSIVIAVMLAIKNRSFDKVICLSCIDCVRYFGAFNTLSVDMGLINRQNLRGASVLDGGLPSYKLFECKDRSVLAVGNIEHKFYREMLQGLNLSQQKFEFCMQNQLNKEEWPSINSILQSKLREKTAKEWETIMAKRDTCITTVKSIETADPAFIHPRLLRPKI